MRRRIVNGFGKMEALWGEFGGLEWKNISYGRFVEEQK